MLNVFNGRIIQDSTPLYQSCTKVGLGPGPDGKTHAVNPQLLDQFAQDLRTGKAEVPLPWKGEFRSEITSVLTSRSKTQPSVALERVLRRFGRLCISRSMGVVKSGQQEVDDIGFEELTTEQEMTAQIVEKGCNTYIGGSAGTGKTVLLTQIRRRLNRKKLSVAMTATTGIASCHIGGATFHHTFGVGPAETFSKLEPLAAYDVIIIDEISMMTRSLFEKFELKLREVIGSPLPFGGVQIILCGDFLQLPSIPDRPIFRSPLFLDNFVHCKLVKQVRQAASPEYAKQLQILRTGVTPVDLHNTVKVLDQKMVNNAVNLLPKNAQVLAANRHALEQLPGDAVTFGIVHSVPVMDGKHSNTVVLETTPAFRSKDYYQEVLRHISSGVEVNSRHLSLYRFSDDRWVMRYHFPKDSPETWQKAVSDRFNELAYSTPDLGLGAVVIEVREDPAGFHTQEDELHLTNELHRHPIARPVDLKVGARVLLRANLNNELVNGSIGEVVGFEACTKESLLWCSHHSFIENAVEQFANLQLGEGTPVPMLPRVDFGEGRTFVIPPWVFTVGGEDSTHYYSHQVVALPLSLAYAFTVHKVQGLTLVGRVHIELTDMWPCNHLLYVAMSRVRTPEQLTVSGFNKKMVIADRAAVEFDSKLKPVDEVSTEGVPLGSWKMTKDAEEARRSEPKSTKASRLEKLAKFAKVRASSYRQHFTAAETAKTDENDTAETQPSQGVDFPKATSTTAPPAAVPVSPVERAGSQPTAAEAPKKLPLGVTLSPNGDVGGGDDL